MSRILRVFAFVVGVFYAGNVLAEGYTCPTYKQYTSCASGYYMTASASSTVHNGTSAVGNACRPCSVMGQYNGVDKYTCVGGTAAPLHKMVTVSYNLNNGTIRSGSEFENRITCELGEPCNLNKGTESNFYRAGYRLVGWSTSSSATSGSFSMTFTAKTTVYAVWSKCASGSYKGTSTSETPAAACTAMSYGYYGTGCDSNQSACTGQAQCTGTTYCEDHIKQECPDPNDTTHQRETFPTAYKGAKFSSAGVMSANGRGVASECQALIWYDPDPNATGQRVGLYEYVRLDDATMRYQGTVDAWAYDAVGPGYYLYNKGGCGAYAYYKSVAVCPVGAACPGKSKVSCSSSNESTVHTETFGLNVCTGGKTTAMTGATTCSATCSNATGANTWTTPTWSSSTKQIWNKCAINTCSTGYTRGGSASSTATSSYTCNANCNKVTLVGTYNGGSGSDLVVYKKTGSTTWYSNSTCTTAITKVSGILPIKQNALYAGHYNTSAASGGTRCVTGTGELVASGSCNVNGDLRLYPQFICDGKYAGSGQYTSGTCTGTVYTITLRNYNDTAPHSTIYEKYNTGWYSNSTATTVLSKASVPTRTGYTFRGFYTAKQPDLTASGGTGTRRITADGTLPTPTTFDNATSLYAAWATNCVQPSNGKCTLTINNDGTATYTTTCNAGYYLSGAGTYKPTCTPCGAGTYSAGGTATSCTTCPGEYTHSDGARSATNNCYLITTAGKYVATAGAGQVTCDDTTTFYYPGETKVYYGKTGGAEPLNAGEWNAVNVGGTCADKEYCPAGTWGDLSGYCEPIPAGYYPEISGCYDTDDDGNGIGCWEYEPCSGLPGVSVTGGTYTSVAQSKNNKACKYTAPAKTIAGCATVTSNTVTYTGSEWPTSTYTVTPSAGYVASNNNTASATCSPGIWTITLDPSSQSGGTGGTSVIYEKYNTGFYSDAGATSPISTITVPTKSGYVFMGYETAKGDEYIDKTGKITASNTTFTANTTLYALFSACAACTKGNGVASCSMSVTNNTCTYSATCSPYYKNPTCTSDGKCSCTGNTFYIKYNAGGGSGNAPTSPTVCTHGASNCWAPANTYTRTGYTFSEWSDGDQPVPVNQDLSIWYGKTDGETITLTAMWRGNSVKCDAGYYVKAGEDKCTTGCSGAFYCPGGTFTISGGDTGKTPCPSTTLGGRVSAWTASGYPSKPEHCLLLDSPFTNIGNGDGTRRLNYNPTSGEYDANAHYYYYESCNAGYQMTKNGVYNGTPVINNECTMCAAGTYKGTKGTGTCAACTGRTQYSLAGASECSPVSTGYYTTGCNASNNNCTNQKQCTGATYCASGVQNNCPAQTSGWTRNGGTGWTAVTQCNQTKTGAAISSYCAGGVLKQNATSATAWGPTTIAEALTAKQGSIVNGQTCTQCGAGTYSIGDVATECAACPAGDAGWTVTSPVGSAAFYECYETRTPQNCASGTVRRNAIYISSTSGSLYDTEEILVTQLESKAGYIVSGTTCAICTGATYSAGGTATSCTTCPSIYTSDKTDGKTKDSQCKVTTTAGQYIAAAGDSTQTKCPVKHYCPSASVAYGTANSPTACPAADSTTERTTYPTDYLNPTRTSFTQQGWSSGLGKITSCSANYGFTNEAGRFIVESVYYNETTKKYDTGGGKYYTVVNPGWYMVDKYSETYCDKPSNRMLYHNVAACPENYYCPGYTTMPLCKDGDYTAEKGKNACSSLGTGVYTKSPAKSGAETACYLTTTATNFVKTANAAEEKCTAGGYCAGGIQVNWNSTGGRTACNAGTYNPSTGSSAASACVKADAGYYVPSTGATSQTACSGATYTETTGATVCTDCPTVDASVTPGGTGSYGYWNLVDNTSVHSKKDGCVAFFNGLDLEHGHVNNYRCYWNVNSETYDYYCTVARGEMSCDAGYFTGRYGSTSTDTTEVGFGDLIDRMQGGRAELTQTCRDVENGYYSPDGDVLRHQCPTNYGHSASPRSSQDNCYLTTTAGNYVKTAGAGQTQCEAGYYCPGNTNVYYSGTTPTTGGRNAAAAGYFVAAAGASQQVACAVGSYTATTAQTACIACGSGTGIDEHWGMTTTGVGQTSCNAECPDTENGIKGWRNPVWNKNNTVTNLCVPNSCVGDHYLDTDTNTCPRCDSFANGLYPHSPSNGTTGGKEACFARRSDLNGYHIANDYNEVATACQPGSYSYYVYDENSGGSVVHYGESYNCTKCGGNTYSDKEAATECTPCLDNYVITSGASHNSASLCELACPGGSYVPYANSTTCANVGVGYYAGANTTSQGEVGRRYACPAGMTTIGYGLGADEAGDCGRILHVGDNKLYLRSGKKTTPSLNVLVDGTKFYGNMSTADKTLTSGVDESLRIKNGNTTYSVYDDMVDYKPSSGSATKLDPTINSTRIVPANISASAGVTNWSAVFSYGTLSGISACTANAGNKFEVDETKNFAAGGSGTSCWCKMTSPATSGWTYITGLGTTCNNKCAYICAQNIGSNRNAPTTRTNMFSSAGVL